MGAVCQIALRLYTPTARVAAQNSFEEQIQFPQRFTQEEEETSSIDSCFTLVVETQQTLNLMRRVPFSSASSL